MSCFFFMTVRSFFAVWRVSHFLPHALLVRSCAPFCASVPIIPAGARASMRKNAKPFPVCGAVLRQFVFLCSFCRILCKYMQCEIKKSPRLPTGRGDRVHAVVYFCRT